MKKLLILLAILSSSQAFAQFVLTKGDDVLELSGVLSAYYNYRFYPTGTTDLKKNRFELRDAQLTLNARFRKRYETDIQVDFANFSSSTFDPENPPVMSANVKRSGWIDLTMGFMKVPYSFNSLLSFNYSPFWQRAYFAKGELFSRRDCGFMLSKSHFNEKLHWYLGAFSGRGENILKGNNDASGSAEMVGRVEFSYPGKFRYRIADLDHIPKVRLMLGGGARYANKKQDFGPDFGIAIVNGKKTTGGIDFTALWNGFGINAEAHLSQITPNDISRLNGFNTTYFNAFGWVVQATYHVVKLKSVIALRYDAINPNNLEDHNLYTQLSVAYSYVPEGWNSALKVQYVYPLPLVKGGTAWQDPNLRVGWQFLIR